MRNKPSLLTKLALSTAIIATPNLNCYQFPTLPNVPSHPVGFPDQSLLGELAEQSGLFDENVIPTRINKTFYPIQAAFTSQNFPNMISSVSFPGVLVVAGRNSPQGYCVSYIKFQNMGELFNKPVIKAELIIPQIAESQAQSTSPLESKVSAVMDDWDQATLSFYNPYLLITVGSDNNVHLFDNNQTPINLLKIYTGGNIGGRSITIVDDLINNSGYFYGMAISPRDSNPDSYKTFSINGIRLEIEYENMKDI